MQKEYINPEGIYPTPWRFNQAVKVSGAATTVYLSGIVGYRPDGSIARDDILDQASNAYESLKKVVEASGATLKDVVKTNVYIGEDYQIHKDELRKIRAKYFTDDALPATTLLEVAGYAQREYLFEIEAIAVIPE